MRLTLASNHFKLLKSASVKTNYPQCGCGSWSLAHVLSSCSA
jgi:hypothetical protein